jgi:hypothetical protein
MRFTSANEHGDANVSDTAYHDRQHTTRDTLGIDTNNDNVIDSFFVDFNYLSRNAIINGNAAGMAAIGPATPDFNLSVNDSALIIHVTQQTQYNVYRVGVRTLSNDWDSVYTFVGALDDTIYVAPAAWYYVSIAAVDTNGIESIFSKEYKTTPLGIDDIKINNSGISLLQNRPNPFDEATYILYQVDRMPTYKSAFIRVTDMNGKLIKDIPTQMQMGSNEVLFEHGYGSIGVLNYSLIIDGNIHSSKQMIFAN